MSSGGLSCSQLFRIKKRHLRSSPARLLVVMVVMVGNSGVLHFVGSCCCSWDPFKPIWGFVRRLFSLPFASGSGQSAKGAFGGALRVLNRTGHCQGGKGEKTKLSTLSQPKWRMRTSLAWLIPPFLVLGLTPAPQWGRPQTLVWLVKPTSSPIYLYLS